MNDLSFTDELIARLDEAADTADVTLPDGLDMAQPGSRTADVAPLRRLDSSSPAEQPTDRRRWASIAAAALIVVGGGVVLLLTRPDSGPASTTTVATTMPSSTMISSPTVPSTSVAGSTVPTTPATTAAPPADSTVAPDETGTTTVEVVVDGGADTTVPGETSVLSRTIVPGDQGEDVLALQVRLSDLGFSTGPTDGVYGQQTVSAVWAFKALVDGEPLDQINDDVTPELWTKINGDVTVAPRRPGSGTHIEIYLPQQVMVVFRDDVPALIAHISSGEVDADGQPVEFCDLVGKSVGDDGTPLAEPVIGESCGVSKTPGGIFEVGVELEGFWTSGIGVLMFPTYFNGMLAIHGAPEVPLHPSSRGGVRVEPNISTKVQTLVASGDKVFVWNGTQEPEDVSKADSLPAWTRFTPDGG